jgi:site-specific recombinase XerD
MIKVMTDGLVGIPPYDKGNMPLFLTDDYEVIEGPTIWATQVSLRRSRSDETLKCYTNVLAEFLQWLDDEDYGAVNWQNVDVDIIQSYISYLIKKRDPTGKPNDKTVEGYIARISDYYKWAKDNGYDHFWHMRRETLRRTIKDHALRNFTVEREGLEFKIGGGKPIDVKNEMQKFLDNRGFSILISLLDDFVYKIMALCIRLTALRPKGLLQLPYLGSGRNTGLRRYRDHELDDLKDISYTFKSKGKYQTIDVPAELWRFICLHWMPERQRRAEVYRQLHGVSPPNSVLFIAEDGTPVTYKMLYDHFKKVASHPDFPLSRMTPYMLRHAFATYFVLEQIKAKNRFGQPYLYDAAADEALRGFMGHNDIDTTYRHYVHLVNRFVQDDLIYDLQKQQTQELLAGFFEAAKLSQGVALNS